MGLPADHSGVLAFGCTKQQLDLARGILQVDADDFLQDLFVSADTRERMWTPTVL
jgi:hypothetical protein